MKRIKGIMLSEISEAEKDKCHMISLICGIYKTKQTKQQQTHRYREKMGVC